MIMENKEKLAPLYEVIIWSNLNLSFDNRFLSKKVFHPVATFDCQGSSEGRRDPAFCFGRFDRWFNPDSTDRISHRSQDFQPGILPLI
jgi:hypothetical protein